MQEMKFQRPKINFPHFTQVDRKHDKWWELFLSYLHFSASYAPETGGVVTLFWLTKDDMTLFGLRPNKSKTIRQKKIYKKIKFYHMGLLNILINSHKALKRTIS